MLCIHRSRLRSRSVFPGLTLIGMSFCLQVSVAAAVSNWLSVIRFASTGACWPSYLC